jgi:transposase-like protein
MPQAVTIKSLPQAFEVIKAMELEGCDWGEDYRTAGRSALVEIIEGRMGESVDRHLERVAARGAADRRNGSYPRWLLTELGRIELSVPRTRHFSPFKVVRAYARRADHIDRMILACFLLGLSTRKVAKALLPVLGTPLSPSTVSRVAKTLDAAVTAFHARPLVDRYRVLMLDGVVLTRKTGAGAIRRPVLVALGIRPDGRKEVIDFRLARAESAHAWELFLNDLHRRGLSGESLELVTVDGGAGLLATLPVVYPHVPVQRCWAHKIRNVLAKVKAADQAAVKGDLHNIMTAENRVAARSAAGRFARRWQELYPKAVACLRGDLDELLACFTFDDPTWRKRTRTTNAIERRFREVRRRTRPMGAFADRTSIERILFAVFSYENNNQGVSAPFPLTQNS